MWILQTDHLREYLAYCELLLLYIAKFWTLWDQLTHSLVMKADLGLTSLMASCEYELLVAKYNQFFTLILYFSIQSYLFCSQFVQVLHVNCGNNPGMVSQEQPNQFVFLSSWSMMPKCRKSYITHKRVAIVAGFQTQLLYGPAGVRRLTILSYHLI